MRRAAALCLTYALTAAIFFAQQPDRYPPHWWTPVQDDHKPAWEILPQSAQPGEVILSKRNELGILSNFAATPFTLHGNPYASVEGFWQMMLYPEGPSDPRAQAAGVTWQHTREEVAQMTGFAAKDAGTLAEANNQKIGIDWVTFEGKRMPYRSMRPGEHYRLIREAMLAKLTQNANVRAILLSTGDLILQPDHIQEPDAPPEWRYFQLWMEIRSGLRKPAAAVDFFDEPKFTVAGVTDNSYGGGHGSDTVIRSAEALTKATASLSHESTADRKASGTANEALGRQLFAAGNNKEALVYLNQASQLNPSDAALHHLIASADESLGHPLDAVREYQKAAELDATEPHLFDWGTELLVHGAPEPANEVFTNGIRRFPLSSRLLLGAAVALYAKGDYPQSAKRFFEAIDLNPADPAPYLFLGKVQTPEITGTPEFLTRLARFAELQPENAWANYYYGISLWKLRDSKARPLLEKAVRLNPKLAAAHLQLGTLYSEQHDLPRAIGAYQKAIEADPLLELAHYRLAAAYRQAGDLEKSRTEIDIFQQLSKTQTQKVTRDRSELQQFVITLKRPPSN
jgi:tetratricopeptide (TPR) repeat protein